jgi:hypothetical protein
MAVLFAKTWFLWWAFAVVIITRWFSVAADDDPSKERESERNTASVQSSLPQSWRQGSGSADNTTA